MKPVYKNHLSWRPGADANEIRQFCADHCLYHELVIPQKYGIDNQDIDDLTTGGWTGFTHQSYQIVYYFFFENECDAMAVKLRCF